jgi:MtN3 and saliva related transmembrane protein
MDVVLALGLVTGALTTVAFLPQVVHTWKTKSAKDLSLSMLVSFTTGVLCWFIYGIWIDSLPIALTNGVTLVLAGANLALILKYG